MRSDRVQQAVDQAIIKHYLCDEKATVADFSGNLLLVRGIVTRYIRKGILPYDVANGGFTVECCEHEVAYRFPFTVGGVEHSLKFAGIADRIDRLDDGRVRVVDYKTGAPHLEFNGLENLFHGEGKDRQSNILQTLLYSMMLNRTRGCDVLPSLYYVRQMHCEDYSPLLIDRQNGVEGITYADYAEEFEQLLRETLEELYNPEIPFEQCEDEASCKYCDFKAICRRG